MPPLRVFFDADVIIAGSASTEGASHGLFRLAECGIVDGITSLYVVNEVRRNLARKVPRGLPVFEALWPRALRIVDDVDDCRPFQAWADPKDVPVVASALTARAVWLCTFNTRHYFGPPALLVLPPGEALRRIREAIAHSVRE